MYCITRPICVVLSLIVLLLGLFDILDLEVVRFDNVCK